MRAVSRLALIGTLVVLLLAPGAEAAHWPFFGGDAGRSGSQPVGSAGKPPVRSLYAKSEASERAIVTPVLTTAGMPPEQRVIYGTQGGRVHLQVLATGAPVGPEEGVAVSDDADAFTGADGSVGFADTSGPVGLGQVFVVHNSDNQDGTEDIAVAQIDETTGELVRNVPVPDSAAFTISSSVVATEPSGETGERVLFFVATAPPLPVFGGDEFRLFRIPITNAASRNAELGPATSIELPGAVGRSSPSLVLLRDASGQPTLYVAVGSGNQVHTFAAGDLSEGPVSPDLGGRTQTPSVRVTPGGEVAPLLYVAADTGGATTVHRLAQSADNMSLEVVASSPSLAGAPAPALAVEGDGGATPNGRLVVTTATNLYELSPPATVSSLSDTDLPAGMGFARTTALTSGRLTFVTRDNGGQLVLGPGAEPVAGSRFRVPAAAGGSLASFGQPSLSRGLLQLASDRGLFVYRLRCANAVTGTPMGETLTGTISGDLIAGLGGEDRLSGLEGDDCLAARSGKDRLDGGAGDDRLSAGAGDDRLVGGTGRDHLDGRSGRDRLTGGQGRDRLYGGLGGDRISGGEGGDVLDGGPGNDRIAAGPGANRIRAGRGNDFVDAENGRRDRVFCGSGRDTVQADRADRLSRCERVVLAAL